MRNRCKENGIPVARSKRPDCFFPPSKLMQICDKVAVATVMKATLVLHLITPHIGLMKAFHRDLQDDVHIVKTIPPGYAGIEPFNKTPIS